MDRSVRRNNTGTCMVGRHGAGSLGAGSVRRNLALGASLWTLGLASPACAATTPGFGFAVNGSTVSATLTINASENFTFGVDNSGVGTVTSLVNSPATGAVFAIGQATAGSAVVGLSNAGVINIVSATKAVSSLGSGYATAVASVATGMYQGATGTTTAGLTWTNTGTLGVQATAVAMGAVANVGFGLYQTAKGETGASASLTNGTGGTISVAADAMAAGPDAFASAVVGDGIGQSVLTTSGPASVSLTNSGTVSIAASASAISGKASASAVLDAGIAQDATTSNGAATATLTNSGTISLATVATATAAATANGGAAAFGYLDNAIYEYAHPLASASGGALSGGGAVSLTNSGTIAITTNFSANGAYALAGKNSYADIYGGIIQRATGASADATAALDNQSGGTITISAQSKGVGAVEGQAYAQNYEGIIEDAFGLGGNATDTLSNAGTVGIDAVAQASGGALAIAHATLGSGISNYAVSYGKDATVSLTNSGTLDVAAVAQAKLGGGSHAFGIAYAGVSSAVVLEAKGYDGTNTADLTNTGTINIADQASVDNAAGAFGAALGLIDYGIYEVAHPLTSGSAYLPGAANLSLTNSGKITITTNLSSSGRSVAGAPGYGGISGGIVQLATADAADANVGLDNQSGGTITIAAQAKAVGSLATAYELVYGGIAQQAVGLGGNATAAISNEGTVQISALAQATAVSYAHATAVVDLAIIGYAESQGKDATVSLTNSGTIAVAALAKAAGSYVATALADADSAVRLYAAGSGGAQSVGLTNTGTITIAAQASVDGSHAFYGQSNGNVLNGIYERARHVAGSSPSTGGADLSLTNSGTITIISDFSGAGVFGIGGDTFGNPRIYRGIYQQASAAAADAAIGLDNQAGGTITIAAQSKGFGSFAGIAKAENFEAIYQYGQSTGGNATASLSNEGTIDISALAQASGPEPQVHASAEWGVVNEAGAAMGDASASLTNSGTIVVSATANAGTKSAGSNVGYVAQAFGNLYGGEGNIARSNGGNASVSLTNSGTIDNLETVSASGVGGAYAFGNGGLDISQSADNYNGVGTAGTATLTNSGTIVIQSLASAKTITGQGGSGVASAANIQIALVGQFANGASGAESITLSNSGTLQIDVGASASAPIRAAADAAINVAVEQRATGSGIGSSTTAALTNAGTLDILATATAAAPGSSAYADGAIIGGVVQIAETTNSASPASITFDNSGTLTEQGSASFTGVKGHGTASAIVVDSVKQDASSYGNGAEATLTNSGTIAIDANAKALDPVAAYAFAYLSSGIYQSARVNAYGSAIDGAGASVSLSNAGTLQFTAEAAATGAAAYAYGNAAGVRQAGSNYGSSSAMFSANLTNSGKLLVVTTGQANGTDNAGARADAFGVEQSGFGYSVDVSIDNAASGMIAATAKANASGTAGLASAYSLAVEQTPSGHASGTAATSMASNVASVVNAGTIAAAASASFTGGGASAHANAAAIGVAQSSFAPTLLATLTNSGTLSVSATATGGDTVGSLHAAATGYTATGQQLTADFTNTGHIIASADVEGGVSASATAIAASFNATVNIRPLLSSAPVATDTLAGTIANSGMLVAMATAKPTGAMASGSALAVGFDLKSQANTATLTNSGTILASAETNGGTAAAYGIRVGTASSAVCGAVNALCARPASVQQAASVVSGVLSINNTGGTIIARESVDGGTTWTHGIAIDTTDAPNPTTITLSGNGATHGSIYGDINLSVVDTTADKINVSGGVTDFDGAINSDGVLSGSLNILSGGTLHLIDPAPTATVAPLLRAAAAAPAAVIMVNSLTVGSGATLAIDVPLTAGNIGPFISANSVTLAKRSTLGLNLTTQNGLYAGAYNIEVVSAPSITGNFTNLTTNLQSPLLVSTVTPCSGGICATITRQSFAAPAGVTLTHNQTAVGGGIEAVYAPTLSGPFADLLKTLFTQNATAYQGSLDQLAGAQYAEYLQSTQSLGRDFNSLLTTAGDCAAASKLRQACRAESKGRIWGAFNYANHVQRGDIESTGYSADQFQMAIGTDMDIGHHIAIGVGGAYVSDTENFSRYGGRIKAKGYQLGAYGVYDTGRYFLKGAFSYTGLNGASVRLVNIGTTAGTLSGTPDVHAWTLSGEVGARVAFGDAVFKPYAKADYTDAKLNGFTETGVAGAALDVTGGKYRRASTELGFNLSEQLGRIAPQVSAGWRHLYGRETAAYQAAFDLAPGSGFDVRSAVQGHNAAVIGAASTVDLGRGATIKFSYAGTFATHGHENSGSLTLSVPFGGK